MNCYRTIGEWDLPYRSKSPAEKDGLNIVFFSSQLSPTADGMLVDCTCYKIVHSQLTIQNDDFLVFADYINTRGHCHKLSKGQSHVNTHKYFFTNRVCEVWNTLPSSVTETSSFNILSDYWKTLIWPDIVYFNSSFLDCWTCICKLVKRVCICTK